MPRIVRNFWLTLDVDGKKTKVAAGPRSAGGGFSCTIQMRSDGDICDDVLIIRGSRDHTNGLLHLEVTDGRREIFIRTTTR